MRFFILEKALIKAGDMGNNFKLRFLFYLIIIGSSIFGFITENACADDKLPEGIKIDKILVLKSERKMTVFKNGKKLKTYKIALGKEPKGHKMKRGDNKTPEGRYRIVSRNPNSQFYKSFRINYPSNLDKAQAAGLGVDPGGDIMVHGLAPEYAWMGKLHTMKDWTLGCIAVTNEEMDELWDAVPMGTVIEIRP